MRELSELEQLIEEMQKPPANVSPEELKELAKALEENELTRELARAIQAGKMAGAAHELEEAAKKDPQSVTEANEALKEALQKLAEKRRLSQALEKLASQLEQQKSNASKGGGALQQLAEMLRRAQQGKEGNKSRAGQGGQQKSLQDLLAALQNLKYGEIQEGRGQPSKQGKESPGLVSIESFGNEFKIGEPRDGEAREPTGLPGGERDTGSAPLETNRTTGQGEKGPTIGLKGELGDGETLSALMPALGDNSKPARGYKELYEALAPAAEDAVVQEEIPLGSRFFIKRYFEAIRP